MFGWTKRNDGRLTYGAILYVAGADDVTLGWAMGHLLTAEKFARLPGNDAYRNELIRGTVCVREPCPGFQHGGLSSRIASTLFAFVTPRRLGTVAAYVGFVLQRNPDTVCGVDVSFVSGRRRGEPYLEGAPDLAVEILWPGNTRQDTAEHVALYLRTGSRLVWVVDPALRTITVHRPDHEPVVLGVEDALSGGDVLPGFGCNVADVFED